MAGETLHAAAAGGAAFGLLFASLSAGILAPLAGILAVSVGLGFALDTGAAAFSRPYVEWITPLALWIADSAERMRPCWERHAASESRFRARLATALG